MMKKSVFLFLTLAFIFSMNLKSQEKMVKFIITTEYGDIKGVLYNDTPQHRDNFIKLVEEGWYNGSIFHRVIKNFMIQGGQGATGKQDPGYTVPAEFVPAHYHQKGALAAARMGDNVNPQRASSGSQFYIVQGQTFNDQMLDAMEQRSGIKYTEEQRRVYTTVGGTPHLDGAYTVFGLVTDGLDVVDKIAAVQTGSADKPVNDVEMTIKVIK
ncbi:MAG: putative bifunctional phosphatase/peptidyl-prolyl cis-trans isomerase [Bacteroidetes bacterium ADurb.Bin041]|jgi:cyclophilin family peptidyl-prolyl cis-trans isomerase|nr:MAG: putative bifunctional phosphatase/peptidyl-prolyl cis-trans isomerase [Bacteroidetes bacterium ADurb.Bin041]